MLGNSIIYHCPLNFVFFSNWTILDFQCWLRFCCTAKWTGYTAPGSTYAVVFPSFLIQVITEHWAESPVLYSRCLLVTYFTYSRVYMSVPVSQFIHPHLIPWWPQICFLHPRLYFCFINTFTCASPVFLGSTRKWYNDASLRVSLISLSLTVSRPVHLANVRPLNFLKWCH